MSRQSKNARNLARAREFSKLRQGGGSGPSQTTPKHGKAKAWWQMNLDYKTFVQGKKKPRRGEEAEA